MSLPNYRLLSENIDTAKASDLAKELGLHPLVATLLMERGVDTAEVARHFLYPSSADLLDPFVLPDMDRAVSRIEKAIGENEKVCIYGDYDVDGVTAVSVLYRYLYSRGVNIHYYIPSREGEGYGMNADAVRKLNADGTNLIITVDTGTTASAEVLLATELGMDVVITDHHTCLPELPNAAAVVNPTRPDSKYPFSKLAGVGVAFKLICALEMARFSQTDPIFCSEKMLDLYGDLVMLGTVADVMPLLGENRYIVKRGLVCSSKTRNPGLAALVDTVLEGRDNRGSKRRNLTGQMIGYSIAPKINAAGRMATAEVAVELFLTESESRAIEISKKLCELNKERQNVENAIVALAVKQINEADLADDPVLVLGDEGWHPGVVGIAASRISDRYGKPTVMISFDAEIGKGSVRATESFDAMEALAYAEDLLVKYGGHTFAAGLTVTRDNFIDLRHRLCEYAAGCVAQCEFVTSSVSADAAISLLDVNLPLAKSVAGLAPFGAGNEMPTFLLSDVQIVDMTPLSGGKHTRITLAGEEVMALALLFGTGPHNCVCQPGDKVDVICNLEINEYGGNTSVQLMIKKLFLSGLYGDKYESEKNRYRSIMQGDDEVDDFPVRSDFAMVYRYLGLCAEKGIFELGYRYACHCLHEMSYPKLRIILDIFKETKLLEYRPDSSGDRFHFSLQTVSQKVDIEKSVLYRRLKPEY